MKLTLLAASAAMTVTVVAVPNGDMWEHVKDHPKLREEYLAKKAGSLQKYLEMDATPGRRIVWKYFEMKQTDPGQNLHLRIAADKIVTVLRNAKNSDANEKGHANVRLAAINDVPSLLKKGNATAEETEAFMTEAARAKAEWIKAWTPGYVETTPAQAAAAANSAQEKERQESIVRSNYLLGDLTDQDRSKANVAKRKAKFEEALMKAQAPDKILGTYSTSRFWKGIPVFKDETLKAKWSSLQEMTYKSFYQRNGKYFVVTGGFRQGITLEDAKRGKSASEVADYWPGLESPVEVPADLIEKHFK